MRDPEPVMAAGLTSYIEKEKTKFRQRMEELVSSKWLSHSFLNNFEKLESNPIDIIPFASHFLKVARWQQVKLANAHGGTCIKKGFGFARIQRH